MVLGGCLLGFTSLVIYFVVKKKGLQFDVNLGIYTGLGFKIHPLLASKSFKFPRGGTCKKTYYSRPTNCLLHLHQGKDLSSAFTICSSVMGFPLALLRSRRLNLCSYSGG